MVKNIKYALMTILIVGGLKLFQTLFVHQEYKIKNAPLEKKEVKKQDVIVEESDDVLTSSDEKEVQNQEVNTFKEEDETNPEKSNKSAVKGNDYPSLEDLKKNYLSIKNASLLEGRSREDVVIRYYKHEKDGNKVYSLRKLRYYLHEKPATETEGLGSNVIYYGDQVKPEDIQIVAYTLLENGIPLKSIERSKFDWKSNAIEIGTDSLLIGTRNMTKDQIRDFKF